MNSVWTVGARTSGGFGPLDTTVEADAVIVGGGITGAMAALCLSDAGLKVVLLEAGAIGASNTGHSTGNLYGTVSAGLAALRAKWDADVVREMVAQRLQAVTWIEQTVQRFALDCGFARRPLYACMAGSAGEQRFEDDFSAAGDAGLAPRRVDAVPQLPVALHRAMQIDGQAQFNHLAFTQGLVEALAERNVTVHEHSAVTEIDADGHRAVTAGGAVHAVHIVLATHTPIGFNLVQAEMQVFREYGISARLEGGDYPQGIFWVRDQRRSIRSYRHEGHDYLVIVGEKHKTGEGDPHVDYHQALRDYARAHFPVAQFVHGWSAQQYQSADGLPYIGPSGHDHVHIATGFAADGLTWGAVAATLIGERIQGRHNPCAERLSPRRFTPLKSARSWMAENAAVTKHLVMDRLTPAAIKGLEGVPAGEGQIVELDGEKVAVYRSLENELSVLSPVCPHLKCQVHWNGAATSWDCPCHGSRFGTDGHVIEGPALHPLTRRA